MSSSGVLMLFGDHTIDGRIFKCVVNSTQLYSPGERNITVNNSDISFSWRIKLC